MGKYERDPNIYSGHFVVLQTGAWEGPGSWCYRIYCNPCGFSEIEDSRDAALEVQAEHRRQPLVLEEGETWEDV